MERALVLQRWAVAHGVRRAVVVGVQLHNGTFRAHAWLDGEDEGVFTELTRVEPPG